MTVLEKQMRKVILGAAAAAMLVGSSMAQAAPASDLRTGAPVETTEQLGGAALWLGLLGVGLLAFVLFQINESDEDSLPTSP
ncbi:MAG: hypothetical protein B7Z08_13325 [Sphingomonadales bacterium 32-68-7]|nr:MAG: hypothetical protein B7Z33_04415 [Sphingomonadales bacterium 12-68-11]OYX06900.1 MAG: hypothetical protein B7Z08_13325 [Sphingomonadales bacterium 32-68-7]